MPSDPCPETIASARADELVLMLFDGAERFGRMAVDALDAGRPEESAEAVGRVRSILAELDRSLNPDAGAVSRHLAAIYAYLQRRLSTVPVAREVIVEVVSDMATLAESWSVLVARRDAELAAA